MSDPEPLSVPPRHPRTVERLLALSHARLSDRVLVAGVGGFDHFIELCRRGFTNARYETAKGPHGGDEADLVLIPRGESISDRGLMAGLRGAVHPGGLLIAHFGRAPARSRLEALRERLGAAGFALIQQQRDHGGLVITARRQQLPALAKAA
jgi:hypothetical protein